MDPAFRPRLLVLALAFVALSSPALADDFFIPLRTVRTRITVAGPGTDSIVGRLLEIRGDTVTVVRGREALDVPAGEIQRIEVGRGFHRATAPGALVGLVVGSGFGALGGATSEDSEWQALRIAFGAIIGGIVGTGCGALVGSGIVREKWDPLPLDRLRVGSAGDAWAPIPPYLPVRVTAPLWRKGRWVGTVRARAADSLLVVRRGREAWIPTPSITRLETSWSKERRGAWGALIGFGAGFVAGVLVYENSRDGSAVGTGTALGLVGALGGALIGGQVRISRWEEIPVDPPALQPVPGATPAPAR